METYKNYKNQFFEFEWKSKGKIGANKEQSAFLYKLASAYLGRHLATDREGGYPENKVREVVEFCRANFILNTPSVFIEFLISRRLITCCNEDAEEFQKLDHIWVLVVAHRDYESKKFQCEEVATQSLYVEDYYAKQIREQVGRYQKMTFGFEYDFLYDGEDLIGLTVHGSISSQGNEDLMFDHKTFGFRRGKDGRLFPVRVS